MLPAMGGRGRGVRSRGDTLYFIRSLSASVHEDDTSFFFHCHHGDIVSVALCMDKGQS